MNNENSKLAEMYDTLSSKTREIFNASSEKTAAALERAIETARENLVKAGDVTQKESEHLKTYLRRDLEQFSAQVGKLNETAKDKLEPTLAKAEVGFLDLTSHIAHSASELFERLGEWADSKACYRTGQVTSPGILRCLNCEKEMHFKKPGNIPPCPACKKTEFRKVG